MTYFIRDTFVPYSFYKINVKLKDERRYRVQYSMITIMIKYLGRHYIIDIYGCSSLQVNNLKFLIDIFNTSIELSQMCKVDASYVEFKPVGVSGVILLKESHISFHSWPNLNYISIDIYSCGDITKLKRAVAFILKQFESDNYQVQKIDRGPLPIVKANSK